MRRRRRIASVSGVLFVMLDDVGIEQLAPYVDHYSWAGPAVTTPNLEAFAAAGLTFLRAYTCPECATTRAQIETGKFNSRTGNLMGNTGDVTASRYGMGSSLLSIPKFLAQAPGGWECAAFGKSGIGGSASDGGAWGGIDAPRTHRAYGHFDGMSGNLHYWNGDTYGEDETNPATGFNWITNGASAFVNNKYITSQTVDKAITWIAARTGRWFARVWLNAAHQPVHEPPAALGTWTPPLATNAEKFAAMIEAADTELGRLLAALPADVCVIIAADNGSPGAFLLDPFDTRGQGKGTFWEAGVRVPLFIQHPEITARGNAGAIVEAPVGLIDISATIVQLAGGERGSFPTEIFDSRSLVPFFYEPGRPSPHLFGGALVVESFAPAGTFSGDPKYHYEQAGIDGPFKLIRNVVAGTEGFYNVVNDIAEASGLDTGNLTVDQQRAYNNLAAILSARSAGYTAAQWALPDSDKLRQGTWQITTDGGTNWSNITTNGYTALAYVEMNPTQMIRSPLNPNLAGLTGRMRFTLSNITLPATKTGWVFGVGLFKSQGAASVLSVTISLMDGANIRKQLVIADLGLNPTVNLVTLSEAEATTVASGTDLDLLVEFNKTSGANCYGHCFGFYLRAPVA